MDTIILLQAETTGWLDSGLNYLRYGAMGIGALFFIITAILFAMERGRDNVRASVLGFLKTFLRFSMLLFVLGLIAEIAKQVLPNNAPAVANIEIPQGVYLLDGTGEPFNEFKITLPDGTIKTFDKFPESGYENIRRNIEKNENKLLIKNSSGTALGYLTEQDLASLLGTNPPQPSATGIELETKGSFSRATFYPNKEKPNSTSYIDAFPFKINMKSDNSGVGYNILSKDGNKTYVNFTEVEPRSNIIFEVDEKYYLLLITQARNYTDDTKTPPHAYAKILVGEIAKQN